MRKFIYIGLFGAAGAILRNLITQIPIENFQDNIPLNTLFINLTGCFALGFVMTAVLEAFKLNPDLRLGVATGFLGAYTTFSTLCGQTVDFIAAGYYFSAIDYIIVSAAFGFSATYFGAVLARKITAVKVKDRAENIAAENEVE